MEFELPADVGIEEEGSAESEPELPSGESEDEHHVNDLAKSVAAEESDGHPGVEKEKLQVGVSTSDAALSKECDECKSLEIPSAECQEEVLEHDFNELPVDEKDWLQAGVSTSDAAVNKEPPEPIVKNESLQHLHQVGMPSLDAADILLFGCQAASDVAAMEVQAADAQVAAAEAACSAMSACVEEELRAVVGGPASKLDQQPLAGIGSKRKLSESVPEKSQDDAVQTVKPKMPKRLASEGFGCGKCRWGNGGKAGCVECRQKAKCGKVVNNRQYRLSNGHVQWTRLA
jgi:hypothetical protein